MTPKFSLYYGNQLHTLDAVNGAVYTLDEQVTVTVSATTYTDFDAVEWVLFLENAGNKNSQIFSRIFDCDTLLPLPQTDACRPGYMPKPGDLCVITMNGIIEGSNYWENDPKSATEFSFHREYLGKNADTKTFSSEGGLSSDTMMPFFHITAKDSGYIATIGWSGGWQAECAKVDGGVRFKSGLQGARFYLKPGEKLRTTGTLIMEYTSQEDPYNKFRRLIRRHFSHPGKEGLLAFELWGGLTSEEMKKRLNQLKDHGICFEDVWIDAGWYGQCTKCDDAFSGDWGTHAGEWEVNARVHPEKLRDVSACAQEGGMNLMLWLEPERARRETPIVAERPEYFLLPEDENDPNLLLNYDNNEAFDYIYRTICGFVEDLSLSCYRQDFNVKLAPYCKNNDEKDRIGITEIKHITAMYRLWDALLEKFPGLIIDNCSGGGRRIDIETLRRSIPFFRSDYQCNFNETPEVLQAHNANISRYLPYNGCTSKTKGDTYAIRSSYSSSWGGAFYNAIFQSMTEADFLWAKKVTDDYRAIRKYLSKDFYNHGSATIDDTAWAIWQYHDPDTCEGVVLAFRRENAPFDRVDIPLCAMGGKTYRFTELDSGSTFSGGGILPIHLPQKRSSAIFLYAPE